MYTHGVLTHFGTVVLFMGEQRVCVGEKEPHYFWRLLAAECLHHYLEPAAVGSRDVGQGARRTRQSRLTRASLKSRQERRAQATQHF